MGWLYLLAALVFPPVFILWRPREPLGPRERRVRVAGAIVVVWMLTILWGLRGTIGATATDDLRGEVRDYTPSRQEELRQRAAAGPAASPTAVRPDDPKPDAPKEDGRTNAADPDPDTDVSFDWSADAKGDAGLMLALGWVPGLVYAGLLMLARKAVEPPPVEVVDDPGRDDGRGPGAW
jgi:hypothetical protein